MELIEEAFELACKFFKESNGFLISRNLHASTSSRLNFKNLDDWKRQANKMGFKIFSGTSPEGEVVGYWKAKDKNGNTRGEFYE